MLVTVSLGAFNNSCRNLTFVTMVFSISNCVVMASGIVIKQVVRCSVNTMVVNFNWVSYLSNFIIHRIGYFNYSHITLIDIMVS